MIAGTAKQPVVSPILGSLFFFALNFFFFLLIEFREGDWKEETGGGAEREKYQFVVPLLHEFIG